MFANTAMQPATLSAQESKWLPANLVVGCKYRVSRDLDDKIAGKHVIFKGYTRWMGQYLMAVVDELFYSTYGSTVVEEWLIKPNNLYPL